MKKILVTGGSGFIGSHLCRELLNRGNHVVCLDNLSSGSINNIMGLQKNKHFQFMHHDITVPFDLHIDQIFNLACPASPLFYGQFPIETSRTCSVGVFNVLEVARKCNAPVLQASTSEVYGDPLIHPQTESYRGNVNPVGSRSCYDEGKRFAESLFCDYHRTYGLPIKIVRIFNTYGPCMRPDDGRVMSNFIVQALKGDDLTIFGSGSQSRSFCYVDDLVQGIISILDLPEKETGPVNLGNNDEITMLELAKKIKDLTGSLSKLVFRDLPSDDPVRRRPHLDLAELLIQWKPNVLLDDGIKKTIHYFKSL